MIRFRVKQYSDRLAILSKDVTVQLVGGFLCVAQLFPTVVLEYSKQRDETKRCYKVFVLYDGNTSYIKAKLLLPGFYDATYEDRKITVFITTKNLAP